MKKIMLTELTIIHFDGKNEAEIKAAVDHYNYSIKATENQKLVLLNKELRKVFLVNPGDAVVILKTTLNKSIVSVVPKGKLQQFIETHIA